MSLAKGSTATVISGKKSVGATGVVVWIGGDKFKPELGDACRVGLKVAGFDKPIYVNTRDVSIEGARAMDIGAAPATPAQPNLFTPAPKEMTANGRARVEALEAALTALVARVEALEAERAKAVAAAVNDVLDNELGAA